MLHGIAGTGKSFLALYLALRDILSGISNQTEARHRAVGRRGS
jgi:predicted ribonuclease YlaK